MPGQKMVFDFRTGFQLKKEYGSKTKPEKVWFWGIVKYLRSGALFAELANVFNISFANFL
jgi:hypothetical protein